MPVKKDLMLDKYGISRNRYRELASFCLQYPEWKRKLEQCYTLNAVQSGGVSSSNISDTTASAAMKAMRYRDYIDLIETTCQEADPVTWECLLQAVTRGTTYDKLMTRTRIPQNRRDFYTARRRFFYLLSEKK